MKSSNLILNNIKRALFKEFGRAWYPMSFIIDCQAHSPSDFFYRKACENDKEFNFSYLFTHIQYWTDIGFVWLKPVINGKPYPLIEAWNNEIWNSPFYGSGYELTMMYLMNITPFGGAGVSNHNKRYHKCERFDVYVDKPFYLNFNYFDATGTGANNIKVMFFGYKIDLNEILEKYWCEIKNGYV